MDITILLDIDGTLLDLSQKPTVDTLPVIIERLKSKGVHFGLNSNRAFEDVEGVINEFGLDGPFILENGAYVINFDGSKNVLCQTDRHIQTVVLKELQNFDANATVHVEDTTKLYTEKTKLESTLNFYVNKYRKYTVSIHHRIGGISRYSIAVDVAAFLNSFFSENSFGLMAIPHEHGHSVTIEYVTCNKGSGIMKYRESHPNQQIFSIGDGINDVAQKDYVDKLYAVANAVPELKKVADHVSSLPITAGVEEILLCIEKELE